MNIRLRPETRHLLRMVWTLLGEGARAYIWDALAHSDRLPKGAAHFRLYFQYITAMERRRFRGDGMRDTAAIAYRTQPGFERESTAAAYVREQARLLSSMTLNHEIHEGRAVLMNGVSSLNTRLWQLADGSVREEVL